MDTDGNGFLITQILISKIINMARCQWLMPVILATQEAEIRRIMVKNLPGQIVCKTLYGKKSFTKKGLVRWLKVKALSLSPSITKKKKKVNMEAITMDLQSQ
jgi:hypothetical protein